MTNHTSSKSSSWKLAILLSLGLGLLAAGLSVFIQVRSQTAQSSAAIAQATPPGTASAAVGSGSSFKAPGKPVRLIIPAIGVDANIQSVGLSWKGDGSMGIPTNFTDVAWYKDGPAPGTPGSAVIDGHLDGRTVQRAVFYDLGKLKARDAVSVVDAAGTTWRFEVIRLVSYDYDASATDIFSRDTSSARLNLITCAGDWDKNEKLYDKRIVVFTELIASP